MITASSRALTSLKKRGTLCGVRARGDLKKFENKFGARSSSRFCSQQPEEHGGRIWVVDCIFGSQGSVIRKKRGTFWMAFPLRIGNQELSRGQASDGCLKFVLEDRKRHGGRILVIHHNNGSQAASPGERGTSGDVACESKS